MAGILAELGIDANDTRRIVEVWNKIDLLDANGRERVENIAARRPEETQPVLISAMTGEGTEALLRSVEERVTAGRPTLELDLDPADGAGLGWLHRQTEVLSRTLNDRGRMSVTVRVDPTRVSEVRRRFPSAA